MALYVNTNVSALNAQKNLSNVSKNLDTAFERLSSGKRVNGAKDDAAGLQISDRLTAQIKGMEQAQRNANDAISVMQVAEGALDEVTNALQRMRELASRAGNSTLSTDDYAAIQKEMNALVSQIDAIASRTSFGSQANRLIATDMTFTFQVGAYGTEQINVTLSATNATSLSVTTGNLTIATTGSQADLISYIDGALAMVGANRATIGAAQNQLTSTVRNLSTGMENITASRSRILDADFAAESANMTKYNIIQQAASTILAQANQRPQAALSLLG